MHNVISPVFCFIDDVMFPLSGRESKYPERKSADAASPGRGAEEHPDSETLGRGRSQPRHGGQVWRSSAARGPPTPHHVAAETSSGESAGYWEGNVVPCFSLQFPGF